MKKVVFSGCSFTFGTGWPLEKGDPHLWVNLCHKNIKGLGDLELINVGKNAISNTEIFERTVKIITEHTNDIELLFCQWTSGPRYSFNAGFELWNTHEDFFNSKRTNDINLNRGDHWPREYVNDLIDRIKVLHHLHWEVVKIVNYSSIIKKLGKLFGINIFFINGLCPWDKDYFLELHDVRPEEYTPFTKKEILNIDTRDDKDIYALYSLAHKHYKEAGGIDALDWINLYNSLLEQRIDVNPNGYHPGTQSNIIYYQMIDKKLKELHQTKAN